MTLDLKVRKVGNSLGVVLPKEVLGKLNAEEGDTLVFSDSADGGFRITPDREDFARQMAIAEDVANRYRNALKELAK